MLYGCETLGKLSKSLENSNWSCSYDDFLIKCFQNLSQIKHFGLILLDFSSLIGRSASLFGRAPAVVVGRWARAGSPNAPAHRQDTPRAPGTHPARPGGAWGAQMDPGAEILRGGLFLNYRQYRFL